MLTLEEYVKQYPESCVSYILSHQGGHTKITGMLKFNKETASGLSGPYHGDYGLIQLNDYSDKKDLQTIKELQKSELKFQKKLEKKYGKGIKVKGGYKPYWHLETPTKEKPFSLRISGNDDSSYTKFFNTYEEAMEELKLLKVCEPLDLQKDFKDNDFNFTN